MHTSTNPTHLLMQFIDDNFDPRFKVITTIKPSQFRSRIDLRSAVPRLSVCVYQRSRKVPQRRILPPPIIDGNQTNNASAVRAQRRSLISVHRLCPQSRATAHQGPQFSATSHGHQPSEPGTAFGPVPQDSGRLNGSWRIH